MVNYPFEQYKIKNYISLTCFKLFVTIVISFILAQWTFGPLKFIVLNFILGYISLSYNIIFPH